MKPEVLSKLADFLQVCGGGDNNMLDRYVWFSNNSEEKENCRYAKMAKEFFEKDRADDVKKVIIWLHENWAKNA